MAEDRLPIRSRPGAAVPARRDGRPPAPSGGTGPIHAATTLGFGGSSLTREQVWDRLGDKLRDRVNARVGELVEWWAWDVDGRGSAVVLGTREFVTVLPTVNASGGPAHEIRALKLDGSTFRRASVSGPPDARPDAAPTGSGSRPGTPPAAPKTRLSAGMSGFLGNLPVRAQQLLQEPFVGGEGDLWHDHHYYRHGSASAMGGASLQVWCYLADKRHVTFATGVGQGYRPETGPRSWDLTCWRVEVLGTPR
ncbi:hypothetical protein [Actinosynnema sp. NPDC020468]|uniref:hypothetical protein n=1 Tax=Actinosynnema sp. NPDC020468 TaxID=3154488 RepID=UPI0033ED254F